MFKKIFGKTKIVESTSFSTFIRSASSGEKTRVYSLVLERATLKQVRTIEEAARIKNASASTAEKSNSVDMSSFA